MIRTAIAIAIATATAIATVGLPIAGPALAAEQALPPIDDQIAGAVQAAPAGLAEGAGVLGWRQGENGLERQPLREPANGLLCLADDPRDDRFEAACYPTSLDPFMARGRALRAAGIATGKERNEIRWREIEAGELAMPREPTTLHILEGERFDPATGTVTAPYRRWVIYIPYATAEGTGLTTVGNDREPWLMVAGTPSAHIMITPPRPVQPAGEGDDAAGEDRDRGGGG